MKIAIDLTSLSYHMTGIERYAACISEELIKIDTDNEYILVFRNEIYESFLPYVDKNNVSIVVTKGKNKIIFSQIILPITLYGMDADVFLFLAFTNPILFKKGIMINTIHDMGPWDHPQALDFIHKVYYRLNGFISAKFSYKIITVSFFSRDRIHEIFSIPLEKINVAYSAVSNQFKKEHYPAFYIIRDKYNIPEKYIMTLSTLEPRKNMILLLEAFSEIKDQVDYDLVLVGRKGWKMDEILEKYNKDGRIHITGFVDDEDVASLYKNAMSFVFPTLYEGFGLPPIEALSLGTPVISSDAASMPEVLRKQAVFFKSNDKQELSELLLNLKKNVDDMPHELDEFQRKNYKFEESARKILKIILRSFKK